MTAIETLIEMTEVSQLAFGRRVAKVVGLKDWIDDRLGGLNCVLTGEERSIAGHGVAQKPLVGRFLSRPFFEQVEFSLLPDELLPGKLDASGDVVPTAPSLATACTASGWRS
jgi:hypothetical protein